MASLHWGTTPMRNLAWTKRWFDVTMATVQKIHAAFPFSNQLTRQKNHMSHTSWSRSISIINFIYVKPPAPFRRFWPGLGGPKSCGWCRCWSPLGQQNPCKTNLGFLGLFSHSHVDFQDISYYVILYFMEPSDFLDHYRYLACFDLHSLDQSGDCCAPHWMDPLSWSRLGAFVSAWAMWNLICLNLVCTDGVETHWIYWSRLWRSKLNILNHQGRIHVLSNITQYWSERHNPHRSCASFHSPTNHRDYQLCHVSLKESGEQNIHPMTYKLAKYSAWNVSRDFWNFANVPIDAWWNVGNYLLRDDITYPDEQK